LNATGWEGLTVDVCLQSLNEWVSRVAPDLPTTIFVLLHLAEKLEKVHAHGLCHRDIKPANVLWRPSANAWTLMDFGCAAALGVIHSE
jgi:serine/threonine protein kinase